MKKLLLLITGLFLLVSIEGQILRYGNYVAPPSTSDFYNEYDTIYAAFTTKPHDTIATIQEALVYSLDTAGYWDRMDIFYVFAGHNSTDALINWISPGVYTATNVNETAWTQWVGFTGDGVADYINTNWNPSTNGENYTQDDASVGIYIASNFQEDSKYVFGSYNGTHLRVRGTTDALGGTVNSTVTFAGTSITDSRGVWILTRTASNAVATYQDGTNRDSDNDASTGVPINNMGVLNRIGANGFSAHTVGIFFVLDGVTITEADEISDIINSYITSISE